MTHADLVKAAARWLEVRRRHPIVLVDVHCNAVNELPDVIGWTNQGVSTVIECKASRGDFTRDGLKSHRRNATRGMGLVRWYAAPPNVIPLDALPERWGLIEVITGGRVRIMREPRPFYEREEKSERVLLVQALRRATEGWGRRMFGEGAPPLIDGDPHPTAAKLIAELRAENTKLRAKLRRVG